MHKLDIIRTKIKKIKSKRFVPVIVLLIGASSVSGYILLVKTNKVVNCDEVANKVRVFQDSKNVTEAYNIVKQASRDCYQDIDLKNIENASVDEKKKKAESYYFAAKNAYLAGDKENAKKYSLDAIELYQSVSSYDKEGGIDFREIILADLRDGIYDPSRDQGQPVEN